MRYNLCELNIRHKDVTRTLIGGGGGRGYIHVLPDRFLSKLRNLDLI